MDFVSKLLLDDLYCNVDVGKCSCALSAITHIGPLMRELVLWREKVMSEVLGCINICQIVSCSSLRSPYCQYCLPQNFQCVHHIKFLLHCGVLLRRLRIQLRAASSWASLLPTGLHRASQDFSLSHQCHTAIPYSSHECLQIPKECC